MNPIVRFIRQPEPNSTTVLLMKLQSTPEGGSLRASGARDALDSPSWGSRRAASCQWLCQEDKSVSLSLGERAPWDKGNLGFMGSAMTGKGGVCALRIKQGILAYLNEPVSASSAANCPGTAFRRARSRRSSSHCVASWRERKRQVVGCWHSRRLVQPYLPAQQAPVVAVGGRETGTDGHTRCLLR